MKEDYMSQILYLLVTLQCERLILYIISDNIRFKTINFSNDYFEKINLRLDKLPPLPGQGAGASNIANFTKFYA